MENLKPEEEQKILNPQIHEVQIGVRELRNISIYPLSFADEIKLTDLISEALRAFLVRENQHNDMAFVAFMVDLIKKNLSKIISLVTDEEGEDVLQDITNVQMIEIVNIIYDVNFEIPSKNARSLTKKVKTLFPSVRPQPQSANSTDTNLNSATEEVGKTED